VLFQQITTVILCRLLETVITHLVENGQQSYVWYLPKTLVLSRILAAF